MPNNLTGLWYHRDFTKLWAGQTVSSPPPSAR